MQCLVGYPWPGNVRELHNELQRALALGEGAVLGAELLSPRVRNPALPRAAPAPTVDGESGLLKHRLDRFEERILREAMARHKGNKTHVADELGLTRLGLRMKLARLGLEEA
jgi:two-component system response regulator HupR/HoxA